MEMLRAKKFAESRDLQMGVPLIDIIASPSRVISPTIVAYGIDDSGESKPTFSELFFLNRIERMK